MASSFGFVYLLGNDYMPDVFKIGYSDRAPHQRAQELSASTSCPYPFHVICYIEVEDAPAREKDFHRNFASYRISDNREFFHIAPTRIYFLLSAFVFFPKKLAITKSQYFDDLVLKPEKCNSDFLWDVYKKNPEAKLSGKVLPIEVEKEILGIPF